MSRRLIYAFNNFEYQAIMNLKHSMYMTLLHARFVIRVTIHRNQETKTTKLNNSRHMYVILCKTPEKDNM